MKCGCDAQTSNLLDFETALTRILDEASPISEIQIKTIGDALDSVLADNILAPFNVPPHNNSAMDGYAVRSTDLSTPGSLTLVGTVLAGQYFDGTLEAGQCLRIMTGAPVPASADAVVMQENTEVNGTQIKINQAVRPGENVRLAGEDIAENSLVLQAGEKLCPSDIGLLASLGIEKIHVIRKVKIALISTGDELVEPGTPLKTGQIYESNRYALKAMLQRLNLDIIDFGIIEDTAKAIEAAFIEADLQADVVISSGGVSVGDADYVKPTLTKLGKIGFWKLAIKPGKPFAFGSLPNSHFMGLPGNPVSALVTFNMLVVPFLRKLSGAAHITPATMSARAESNFKKKPGRLEFQRAIGARNDEGTWIVKATGAQGSGILSSISKANGFVVLAADGHGSEIGQMVDFHLFDSSMSRF